MKNFDFCSCIIPEMDNGSRSAKILNLHIGIRKEKTNIFMGKAAQNGC
jgi:hypothetical protein